MHFLSLPICLLRFRRAGRMLDANQQNP